MFPGEPINNKLSGNVVDLCPVGALCSKDFLYKQRVWYLKSQKSVCADCSTACSVHVDSNKNVLYRLRPRENPNAQGYFMCDEGRLGFHYVNSAERFTRPLVRKDGKHVAAPWSEVAATIRTQLKAAAERQGSGVVGVVSPFLTCEEAYLFAKFLRGLSAQARLALGPIPVVGEDDVYPKDRHGRPVQPVKFTIRAEKCPNRRGVEEVLRHFQSEILGFDSVVRAAVAGELQAVYLAAGYPPHSAEGWITKEQAAALRKTPLLIVQDLLPSPASSQADFVVPAAAWAEKDGTFVNHAGLAQAVRWAVTPSGDCRSDGQTFLDLMERRGLIHAPTVRKEMAKEVPYFAALAETELGEFGIFLQSDK